MRALVVLLLPLLCGVEGLQQEGYADSGAIAPGDDAAEPPARQQRSSLLGSVHAPQSVDTAAAQPARQSGMMGHMETIRQPPHLDIPLQMGRPSDEGLHEVQALLSNNGDWSNLLSPWPSPPPPPTWSPPPTPIERITIGSVEVALTGNAQRDAEIEYLADMVHLMSVWQLPLSLAIGTLGLFVVHNAVLNYNPRSGRATDDFQDFRHALNVLAAGLAYVICFFAHLVFNKLVLTAVPLPAFVGCVQMGSACLTLLAINGAFGAMLHSRTHKLFMQGLRDCAQSLYAYAIVTDASGESQSLFGCVPLPVRLAPPFSEEELQSFEKRGGADKPARTACCTPHASCGCTACGTRRWVGVRIGSRADLWRWMPAALLHSGSYLLLLHALRQTSVTGARPGLRPPPPPWLPEPPELPAPPLPAALCCGADCQQRPPPHPRPRLHLASTAGEGGCPPCWMRAADALARRAHPPLPPPHAQASLCGASSLHSPPCWWSGC